MVDRLPLLAGTPSPTPEAAGWPQPQEGSFHGILWLQPRIPVCFFFLESQSFRELLAAPT